MDLKRWNVKHSKEKVDKLYDQSIWKPWLSFLNVKMFAQAFRLFTWMYIISKFWIIFKLKKKWKYLKIVFPLMKNFDLISKVTWIKRPKLKLCRQVHSFTGFHTYSLPISIFTFLMYGINGKKVLVSFHKKKSIQFSGSYNMEWNFICRYR